MEEQVDRSAVAHQVVHVKQQYERVGLDDLEPYARALRQVERTHKRLFVGLKLLRRHLLHGYLEHIVGHGLLNDFVVVVCHKVAQDIRMGIYHLAHGLIQLFSANLLWQLNNKRQIVAHSVWRGLAISIYTLLRKTQADALWFMIHG